MPDRIFATVRIIWFALLAYVAFGGIAAAILGAAGFVKPFCGDAAQDIYPVCTPCMFYWSVAGVIEIAPCSHPSASFLLQLVIGWPRLFVVSSALAVYPIVDFLRDIWPTFPQIILPALILVALLRTFYVNILLHRTIARGANRVALLTILLLALVAALNF